MRLCFDQPGSLKCVVQKFRRKLLFLSTRCHTCHEQMCCSGFIDENYHSFHPNVFHWLLRRKAKHLYLKFPTFLLILFYHGTNVTLLQRKTIGCNQVEGQCYLLARIELDNSCRAVLQTKLDNFTESYIK